MSSKTVLCFSGGLDSTILLYHLIKKNDDITCLNFSYGAKHNLQEKAHAQALCSKFSIPLIDIELPFVDKLFKSDLLTSTAASITGEKRTTELKKKMVVPGRNTIMLSIALGFAESLDAEQIAIANHADDHNIFPDTRPEWVASMTLLAYHATEKHIKVYAPFAAWTKAEICRYGSELGVPFENTWTCYLGKKHHCGNCDACLERKKSFLKSALPDPTHYEGLE